MDSLNLTSRYSLVLSCYTLSAYIFEYILIIVWIFNYPWISILRNGSLIFTCFILSTECNSHFELIVIWLLINKNILLIHLIDIWMFLETGWLLYNWYRLKRERLVLSQLAPNSLLAIFAISFFIFILLSLLNIHIDWWILGI